MELTREDVRRVIQVIPGGSIVYQWAEERLRIVDFSDGIPAVMGETREELLALVESNPYQRLYAEDIADIQQQVIRCLDQGEEIDCSIRIRRRESEALWVHLRGKLLGQLEGVPLLLVTFQDFSATVKRVTYELELNKRTLEASLEAGKQMCCEYDYKNHTLTGKTGKSVLFGMPNCIEDFPESILSGNLLNPEDKAMIREKLRELDEGSDQIQFDARICCQGKMCWFRFCFKRIFDKRKGYPVIICNFMDINTQKAMLLSYQNHLDAVMRMNTDSLGTFRINLTQNTCSMGSSAYWNILKLQNKGTATGYFEDAVNLVKNKEDKERFLEIFSLRSMLEQFEKGNQRISMEFRYELENGHSEWVRTVLDLLKNPETNDVEGVLYSENINQDMIESMILKETMRRDYAYIVIQFVREDEYYLFDNINKEYGVCYKDLWGTWLKPILAETMEDERAQLEAQCEQKQVLLQLENQNEYKVAFRMQSSAKRRYQLQFSYVDRREEILMITVRDITDELLLDQLRYDSDHDALTDLYNLKKFYKECDRLLCGHQEETFAIVRLDIQRFRLYNSFYGEKEGDKLLCYIADMLRVLSKTHAYGVYGRSHADVFLLCFPMREGVIEWNKKYIHDYLQRYRNDFYLAGSSGIYISKGPHESAEILVNRATLALRSNSNKQMNRVCFYDESIEANLKWEQEIAQEIGEALQQEQFQVYIQPKYNVKTNQPVGGEALVRWFHPKHGMISPGRFIPVLEKNGFIMELDRYMWEHVCMLLRKWLDAGIALDPVSVNMSRVSMYSHKTVPYLRNLVEKYQIPPRLLNLELTESAFMENPGAMKRRLTQLKAYGFKIMMDDFGSAYSNLNTLRELPFDFLKVDRKFLVSVNKDSRSRIVLESVVKMAAALEMQVIVEGVETQGQRDFVASIGGDYIQGYFYAKPMSAERYEKEILHG